MALQPESAEAIMAKYAAQFPDGIMGAEEAVIVSAYRTFQAQLTREVWEKIIFLELDKAASAAIRNLPIGEPAREKFLHTLQKMGLPLRDYKMMLPTVVIPDDAATREKFDRMVYACREIAIKRHNKQQ